MEKLLAGLGIAAAVFPLVAPVAAVTGDTGADVVQVAGVALVASTKAVVDIKGILDKRKEKKARRAAALR